MTGVTQKQIARQRFFELIKAREVAAKYIDTLDGRMAFCILSVNLHAAKAGVPKRYWKYAR